MLKHTICSSLASYYSSYFNILWEKQEHFCFICIFQRIRKAFSPIISYNRFIRLVRSRFWKTMSIDKLRFRKLLRQWVYYFNCSKIQHWEEISWRRNILQTHLQRNHLRFQIPKPPIFRPEWLEMYLLKPSETPYSHHILVLISMFNMNHHTLSHSSCWRHLSRPWNR